MQYYVGRFKTNTFVSNSVIKNLTEKREVQSCNITTVELKQTHLCQIGLRRIDWKKEFEVVISLELKQTLLCQLTFKRWEESSEKNSKLQ